ncbi:MAG: hypothetical protein ACFFGP_15675 [Promethearchaeota archaeon]
MKEQEGQTLVINVNLTRGLVLLLTLALLTATFLGYLAWGRDEASASSVQAPLTTSAFMRQYYLTDTPTGFTGADADTACAAGYHMASLYEILDTSNLKYNTDLGASRWDSGEGPPGGVPVIGWVRTGNYRYTDAIPGKGNCDAWSSSSSEHSGTFAALPDRWDTGQDIHVWNVDTLPCDTEEAVWCVED